MVMANKKHGLKRKIIHAGGWQVAKRVAKMVPFGGTAIAVVLVGSDIKKKGVVNGLVNSGLDAIPFVGLAKNVVELFRGDFIADKGEEEVNDRMSKNIFGSGKIAVIAFLAIGFFIAVAETNAQGTRRKRTTSTATRTVPVTQNTEPQIISRAEDFPDAATQQPVQANPIPVTSEAENRTDDTSKTIEDLKSRVKSLESVKKSDQDENQKRLLMNLDILMRAEQRADTLRKQLFEMIEKESTIRTKLDQIENNIRPETIDREVAFAGTMRPEELRNMRKKNLDIERTNLTALLAEVQKTKANIDQNVQRADLLVERFRAKMEKEIDDLLTLEPTKQ